MYEEVEDESEEAKLRYLEGAYKAYLQEEEKSIGDDSDALYQKFLRRGRKWNDPLWTCEECRRYEPYYRYGPPRCLVESKLEDIDHRLQEIGFIFHRGLETDKVRERKLERERKRLEKEKSRRLEVGREKCLRQRTYQHNVLGRNLFSRLEEGPKETYSPLILEDSPTPLREKTRGLLDQFLDHSS